MQLAADQLTGQLQTKCEKSKNFKNSEASKVKISILIPEYIYPSFDIQEKILMLKVNSLKNLDNCR